MKRRRFGLMAATSAAALGAGVGIPKPARAGVSADQAALLKTTLTPMGAERAGNADGSIPAWTGGLTEVPAGWTNAQPMPDFFASDPLVVKIDSSNMAQYQSKLTAGTMLLMQKYGFSIDVYPTHRTAAAPQWLYDNTYQNALNSHPVSAGIRLGFEGAYGGIPFPIPDPNDPLLAGGQIVWNHLTRWSGVYWTYVGTNWSMVNNQLTLLGKGIFSYIFYYYDPKGTIANYNGLYLKGTVKTYAPPSSNGGQLVVWTPTNPTSQPESGWQVLEGQGRVRRIPQVQYDVRNYLTNGLENFDEAFSFYGNPDEYDWKLIGKQEFYIPYNCNKMFSITFKDFLPNYVNPDLVRWELHRVWVVEGTVHSGDRNVISRRRIYVDEDSWNSVAADEYDGNGDYWKTVFFMTINRPDAPVTVGSAYVVYNFQQQGYVLTNCQDPSQPLSQKGIMNMETSPDPSLFDPQNMAANASY